jgi:single-strand DNA-binding protein
MKGRNVCTFIGNLGGAPELKYTSGGEPLCKFSLAVNKTWKNQAGETQEKTTWVDCVAWGKLAELCNEYLTKGAPVHIEAEYSLNEYTGDDNIKRKNPQFTVKDVVFLGKGRTPAEASKTGDIPF